MHDYNLFADIKKLLIESHTKEEIKTLSTSELKKLHGEYLAKGTVEAKSEAEMIKKEIESRGEDEGEKKKVEENFDRHRPLGSSMGSPGYADRVFAGASQKERLERAAKERKARLEAEKEAKAKKKPVAEQNEELLAILDTLCEMAGLDMVALVEETRKEMENLGRAYSWDKPAPEGVLASTDRLARVKANMARLGKRRERGALKTGEETAYRIEMGGEDLVHEPSAKERAKGAPSARVDPKGYDKVQDSIEKISDKFTMDRAKKNVSDALKPFTLQPKPKGKGKGKK